MHTIRTVLTNSIGGYTVYSGVDFVCIRRTSVKQGQSLLGYELLRSKRYPVTLSIHFYFRYMELIIYFHSNNLCIIIELFYMSGRAGIVQIWGYPTPTTKWYLALKKEVNGCVNEYPKFIPESFIRVSE